MDVQSVDTFVKRTRLWLGGAMFMVAAAGAGGAWLVNRATAEMHAEIQNTHDDIAALAVEQHRRADSDSVRFERAMDVLELAVAAIVEPAGSLEQRSAVDELRRRRHVVAP